MRSHLSVSIYLSLGGGRFTVNTFCPPNFLMMVIMMENGAVISKDRLCASLCQLRLSQAHNEKWWGPAVPHILSPNWTPLWGWECGREGGREGWKEEGETEKERERGQRESNKEKRRKRKPEYQPTKRGHKMSQEHFKEITPLVNLAPNWDHRQQNHPCVPTKQSKVSRVNTCSLSLRSAPC